MTNDFFSNTVPTKDLKLEQVPNENDSWSHIERFALTFPLEEKNNRAYPRKPIIQLLDENPDISLVELRFLLFFEQRRWNHMHRTPDTESMRGVRELIDKIRRKLE